MRPFRTLHKRWLLSFTSLPTGRDESEEAGCGTPLFRSLPASAEACPEVAQAPVPVFFPRPQGKEPDEGPRYGNERLSLAYTAPRLESRSSGKSSRGARNT
jgi:hypothetical protein